MSNRLAYQVGLRRTWHSLGVGFNWQKNLGWKRPLVGLTWSANLALSLLNIKPLGIKLELLQRRLLEISPNLTPARLQSAREFFEAFSNPVAREFVRQAQINNYTDAIMKHHPNKEKLDRREIHQKCQLLINTIFRRLEDLQARPEFVFDIIESMGRKFERTETIWFSEYGEAYEHYKHITKLPQRDRLLFPHIVGDSLVDIGCGGGDQVAYLKKIHPGQLKRVAGIDVLDWKTPGLDIDYHVIDFSRPGARAPERYDTGLLLAVLHHAGKSEAEVDTFLTGVKTAVSKRLIVEEDVVITREDLQRKDIPGLEDISVLRQGQPILDSYLNFDSATQKQITTIFDFLANSLSVGVPAMAFPFGFWTLSDWLRIFSNNGFILNQVKILGFQKGNFNQVCHVHFILDVNPSE